MKEGFLDMRKYHNAGKLEDSLDILYMLTQSPSRLIDPDGTTLFHCTRCKCVFLLTPVTFSLSAVLHNTYLIEEKSPKTPVGQTHPCWRTGFGVLTVGRGLFRIVVV